MMESHPMTSQRLQFSLQSMLCFLLVISVLFGINLTPKISVHQIWLSIDLPPGESNDREWVTVERGFPLRYQHVSEDVEYGSGHAKIANGWPKSSAIRMVTHTHWLVLDILFAVGLAMLVSASPRLVSHARSLVFRHRVDEQADARETSAPSALKSHVTPRSP